MPERNKDRRRYRQSGGHSEDPKVGISIETSSVIQGFLDNYLAGTPDYSHDKLPYELDRIAKRQQQRRQRSRGIVSVHEKEGDALEILSFLKTNHNLTPEQYEEGRNSVIDPARTRRRDPSEFDDTNYLKE